MVLKDFEDLIDFTITTEERFLFDEFSEDTSDSPNIHSQAVLPLSQQHLRGPIPQRLDLMGQRLDGYTKGPSKSKIRYFKHS